MSEVHRVTVQIKAPSKQDHGQVAEGAYVIEDGLLIMTDLPGKAVREGSGKKYTHKLTERNNPRGIACHLTRELRKALRCNSAPLAGFGDKINYPKIGVV